VIQYDILPTLCDLFEHPIPQNVDGESLLPLLTGTATKLERESIFWHFPYYRPPISYEGTKPCSAIREGNDKLIYFYEDERVELYDLENDMGETSDLSSVMPERTEQLKSRLISRLTEVGARFPTANLSYQEIKD
jgi:arylsulfatase A-like enzyme